MAAPYRRANDLPLSFHVRCRVSVYRARWNGRHMVAVAGSLVCSSPSPPSGEHRSPRSESGDDGSPIGAECGRWLRVSLMVGRIQLWIGLLLFVSGVSYPVAYAAARFLHLNVVASFATIAFALLLVVLLAFKYVRGHELTHDERQGSRIDVMDFTEAAKAAQAVLSDSSNFVVVRRDVTDSPFARELAQHVRWLFGEIESLKAVRGDAELVRQSIAQSTLNQSYIRIGRDIESVEIIVRPGEETIYEIDSFDPSKPFAQRRSIYHWLLAVDQALYGH